MLEKLEMELNKKMKYLINRYSVLDDGIYTNGDMDICEARYIMDMEKADVVIDQTQEEWEGNQAFVDIFVKHNQHIIYIEYEGDVDEIEEMLDLEKCTVEEFMEALENEKSKRNWLYEVKKSIPL